MRFLWRKAARPGAESVSVPWNEASRTDTSTQSRTERETDKHSCCVSWGSCSCRREEDPARCRGWLHLYADDRLFGISTDRPTSSSRNRPFDRRRTSHRGIGRAIGERCQKGVNRNLGTVEDHCFLGGAAGAGRAIWIYEPGPFSLFLFSAILDPPCPRCRAGSLLGFNAVQETTGLP